MDTIRYTPECGSCGIPTDNAKRTSDGITHCRDCVGVDNWYEVIVADPPWAEGGGGAKFKRGADAHYRLMSTDDICRLGERSETGDWLKRRGVRNIASTDAFLFLWATANHLPDALRVMEAWGFEYKTNMVWCKHPQVGLGFYARMQHEILLLGIRGRPAHSQQPKDGTRKGRFIPTSAVHAQRGEHSAKPEAFLDIAEQFGSPRLEMFARRQRMGWDAWGNEVG